MPLEAHPGPAFALGRRYGKDLDKTYPPFRTMNEACNRRETLTVCNLISAYNQAQGWGRFMSPRQAPGLAPFADAPVRAKRRGRGGEHAGADKRIASHCPAPGGLPQGSAHSRRARPAPNVQIWPQ